MVHYVLLCFIFSAVQSLWLSLNIHTYNWLVIYKKKLKWKSHYKRRFKVVLPFTVIICFNWCQIQTAQLMILRSLIHKENVTPCRQHRQMYCHSPVLRRRHRCTSGGKHASTRSIPERSPTGDSRSSTSHGLPFSTHSTHNSADNTNKPHTQFAIDPCWFGTLSLFPMFLVDSYSHMLK